MADNSTAETLKYIKDTLEDVPGWMTFSQNFRIQLMAACLDSADSNLRYERFELLRQPEICRLTLACLVHRLHGVQAKVFAPVAPTVSGVIATALVMKAAGATYKFRQALETYLCQNVDIIPSLPPGPNDPRRQYSAKVLDLCLGDSLQEQSIYVGGRGSNKSPLKCHVCFETCFGSPDIPFLKLVFATCLVNSDCECPNTLDPQT